MPLDSTRPDNRRDEIIGHAARLFGARGYDRTSMRDIAAAVGMLPGSVYYHFTSKEALLAAVHARAIDAAMVELQHAIAEAPSTPWDRLQSAAAAHLRLLVTGGSLAAVVVDGRNQPAAVRASLVGERDRYEAVFRSLVADLPLPPGVQPGPFRLALLGALNWALTWYSPGGDPPEVVARDLFAIFRASASDQSHPQETTP